MVRLQKEIFERLEKPHRLERLEAAFHPLDVASVRAALFELLATGKIVAPDLDSKPSRNDDDVPPACQMRRPPPEALDLSTWPGIDPSALDAKARKRYQRRATAIEEYRAGRRWR